MKALPLNFILSHLFLLEGCHLLPFNALDLCLESSPLFLLFLPSFILRLFKDLDLLLFKVDYLCFEVPFTFIINSLYLSDFFVIHFLYKLDSVLILGLGSLNCL